MRFHPSNQVSINDIVLPEGGALEDVWDAGVGVGLVAEVGGGGLAQEGGQVLVHDHRLQRRDHAPSEKKYCEHSQINIKKNILCL